MESVRLLCVAVALGVWACNPGSPAEGKPPAPATEHPAKEKALPISPVAPPDPPAPPPAVSSVPVPQEVLYLPDGCMGAISTSRQDALKACRRLRRTGRGFEAIGCRCETGDIIEIRPEDPVAYYMETACWTTGATAAEVLEKCRERMKEEDYCSCGRKPIIAVRGPYVRHFALPGSYDDIERYRYLRLEAPVEASMWLDDVGEPPCFAPGTPILTPGGYRPIETIEEGDVVLTFDPDRGELVAAGVLATRRTPAREVGTLTLTDGRTLLVTSNHPFYLAKEARFINAGSLAPGMVLLVYEGDSATAVEVADMTFGHVVDAVYNLTVSSPHTYLANGVLVHNY